MISKIRIAGGRRGDIDLREMAEMGTGGIAVRDLDEKHLRGGGGIETAFSPCIADLMADLQDGGGLE